MKLTIDQMNLICGFLEEMVDAITDHHENCPARRDENGDAQGECDGDGCEINGGDLVDTVSFEISELKKDIAAAKTAQPILTRADNN